MADFTRGLAQCGARVIGLGEHPADALPTVVKRSLADYIRVPSLVDTDAVLARSAKARRARRSTASSACGNRS